MTFKEAVYEILDKHGDQMGVEHLQKLVYAKCKEWPCLGTVYLYRRTWREEEGVETDCRTYEGQPERNMDRVASKKAEDKLFKICEVYGVPFKDIEALGKLFESAKLQETCKRAREFYKLVAA